MFGVQASAAPVGGAPPGPSDDFVTVWRTTAPAETITLPLRESGVGLPAVPRFYNFNVDWGDGSDDDITAWDDAAATHEYAVADDYVVTISGQMTCWYINNGAEKDKLIDILAWGNTGFTDLNSAIRNCDSLVNVTATDGANAFTNCLYTNRMFSGCSNLVTLDVSNWNMGAVTDPEGMFSGCSVVAELAVGNWNTGSMTNPQNMFQSCNALTSIPVGNWNSSNFDNMAAMFQTCAALVDVDLSTWDISSLGGATNVFLFTPWSDAQYDAMLVNFAGQTVPAATGTWYCENKYTEAAARQTLEDPPRNWTITDGGPA